LLFGGEERLSRLNGYLSELAEAGDTNGIQHVLRPLEKIGALIKRSNEQLLEEIDKFTVAQRDGSIIACAALFPFYGDKCGEVAALAVAPECRGHGQGDKLLGYIEKKAMSMGLGRLFLLTTRTSDWFISRGFPMHSFHLVTTMDCELNSTAGHFSVL